MAVKSLKRSTLETGSVADNSMNAGYSFQDFHHLETIQLGGSAASVDFINLDRYASTYKHLQLRVVARDDRNDTNDAFELSFNNSATEYKAHLLTGNGSTASSSVRSDTAFLFGGRITAANATANTFGASIIDILDAFSTTKNKTVRSLNGAASSYSEINLASGAWFNTAAITSVKLKKGAAASNFVTGSRFSLYGIKG